MPSRNFKKDVNKMKIGELREEVKRLRFTVKQRGYSIRGLRAALNFAIEENPLTYRIQLLPGEEEQTSLKRDLAQARAQVKHLLEDRPVASLGRNDPPEGFCCSVCFEQFDSDKVKPCAFGCGHILCDKDVEALQKKECPHCRRPIEVLLPLFLS